MLTDPTLEFVDCILIPKNVDFKVNILNVDFKVNILNVDFAGQLSKNCSKIGRFLFL